MACPAVIESGVDCTGFVSLAASGFPTAPCGAARSPPVRHAAALPRTRPRSNLENPTDILFEPLLVCQRIGPNLQVNDFRKLPLSTFLVPRRLLGMRRPEPSALPSRLRIVNSSVHAS